MRQGKWEKYILAMFAAVCIIILPTSDISADTDGTELQITQPAQLTIQFGPDWAGVEFQLRTDAGLYPEKLAVDETGILHLEIGGSKNYILSCIGSPVPTPVSAEEELSSKTSFSIESSRENEYALQPVDFQSEQKGNPRGPIFVFLIGLFLAAGSLILLYRKERQIQTQSDRKEKFSQNRDGNGK